MENRSSSGGGFTLVFWCKGHGDRAQQMECNHNFPKHEIFKVLSHTHSWGVICNGALVDWLFYVIFFKKLLSQIAGGLKECWYGISGLNAATTLVMGKSKVF